jgi:hypothetical protein
MALLDRQPTQEEVDSWASESGASIEALLDRQPTQEEVDSWASIEAEVRAKMYASMALPAELLNPANIYPGPPIKSNPMPDANDENPNVRNATEFLEALIARVKAGELFIGDLVVDRPYNDARRMNITIKAVRGKNARDNADLPPTGRYAPKRDGGRLPTALELQQAKERGYVPNDYKPNTPLENRLVRDGGRSPTAWELQQVKERGFVPNDYKQLDKYRQPEPTFGYDGPIESPTDFYTEAEERELIGAEPTPPRQKVPEGTRDLDLDL